jgi:hypothetical protein
VPTARDNLRTARQKIINECVRLGINLDEERRRFGGNTKALLVAARNLVNNATPRGSTELLVEDAPPAGAFDGVNTTFTLSAPASGQNIRGQWHNSASNVLITLKKSNANPPAADGFYFSPNTPTTVIVGTPPAADDMLVFTYKTR